MNFTLGPISKTISNTGLLFPRIQEPRVWQKIILFPFFWKPSLTQYSPLSSGYILQVWTRNQSNNYYLMFIACSQTNKKTFILLWYLGYFGGWKDLENKALTKVLADCQDWSRKILPSPPRYEKSCLRNCLFSVPGILTRLPTCPTRHSALSRESPPRLTRLTFCKNLVPHLEY